MHLQTIAIEIEAIGKLTERERKIMQMLAEGMLNNQIADILHISPHTVKNHKENIKTKLKIADCNSLLKVAIKYNEHWGVS